MTPKTQEPKKRGRPRKTPVAPVPQNPDERVATRGYVKCVARTLREHNHRKDNDSICALIAAFAGGMIWVFVILAQLLTFSSKGFLPEWAYWALVLFTVVEVISVLDNSFEGDAYTYITHDTPEITKKLERGELPEPKKEC